MFDVTLLLVLLYYVYKRIFLTFKILFFSEFVFIVHLLFFPISNSVSLSAFCFVPFCSVDHHYFSLMEFCLLQFWGLISYQGYLYLFDRCQLTDVVSLRRFPFWRLFASFLCCLALKTKFSAKTKQKFAAL